MRAATLVAALLALASVFPIVAAADTTGSLAGRVRDGSGKPVAGAFVRASSLAQVIQTTSDANGRYCFVGLVPGTYIVSIQKLGYAPASLPGVAVVAGSQTVADVHFDVALVTISRDYVASPYMHYGQTADLYTIKPSTNPLFATARTIDQLLPFVPGVQVIGGSAAPR
ncbi:MAG TPA: carboxypeptidase-like regulatory domain-containing protein [Candidatus Acidoferrales bacterium]|jgi:hypothetical protein|nr:carboxypeptidase-like regulatory domain-containing protein [Candidatus Acidoferrales bacterium]